MTKRNLWLQGWLYIASGIVLICTLGHVYPDWTMRYTEHCMATWFMQRKED